MLDTCSSRSQKTHHYFVEDNLEQNISIVGIELFQLKLEKNIHTHDLKRLELPRRELTQLNAPLLQALRYCTAPNLCPNFGITAFFLVR